MTSTLVCFNALVSERSRRREEADANPLPNGHSRLITSTAAKTQFLLNLLLGAAFLFLLNPPACATEAIGSAAFDAANKLYEQARFPEAAAAYEKLLQSAPRSEALHFNLGNAWFKAGQTGRAIAAYREAERLSPREPGIRFNLQFARKKATGQETPPGTLGHRTLASLTVNEWTVLAAGAFWIWCLLLALREARPALRPGLSGYTATAGAVCFALAACVATAASQREQAEAVVIVPDAIIRSGPLEEAKVLHQLRDGTELAILDRKTIAIGTQPQIWLQVRDPNNRTGWIKNDQVLELHTRK